MSLDFGGGERKEKVTSTQKSKEAFANPQFELGFPPPKEFFVKNVVVTWFELWGYREGDKGVKWRSIGYLHSRSSSFGSFTYTYVVTPSCISWVYLKHEKMIALICKTVWVHTEATPLLILLTLIALTSIPSPRENDKFFY